MKPNVFIFTLIFLNLLSSCSTISRSDCSKDMFSFGKDHGLKGLSKFTDDIRKVCVRSDATVDLKAYEDGFNLGWASFCTSFHAYESGRKAETYLSFCPAAKEELFREKYLIGKKVYDKTEQIFELEDRIEGFKKKSQLNSNEQIELTRLKDELQTLKRDIQLLDVKGKSLVHTPID
jgi:hypothetical protein